MHDRFPVLELTLRPMAQPLQKGMQTVVPTMVIFAKYFSLEGSAASLLRVIRSVANGACRRNTPEHSGSCGAGLVNSLGLKDCSGDGSIECRLPKNVYSCARRSDLFATAQEPCHVVSTPRLSVRVEPALRLAAPERIRDNVLSPVSLSSALLLQNNWSHFLALLDRLSR